MTSNEDPCTSDDTLIGLDCQFDKVRTLECKILSKRFTERDFIQKVEKV